MNSTTDGQNIHYVSLQMEMDSNDGQFNANHTLYFVSYT